MKNLLLTFGAAALTAMTINANASDALLSPRAAGNQLAAVAGRNDSANVAAACAKTMNGTPRQIQACVEHPATMPGCVRVAAK